MHELFFELLRVSAGVDKSLSRTPDAGEWAALFKICKDQALIAFCFDGVNTLPANQMPPQDIIIKWMALANSVRNRNMVINDRCADIMEMLQADGFSPVILKGQGNATMYPNPLARQSGDIDVWLDAGEDVVKKYVEERDPAHHEYNVHHIDYHCFPEVEVEMHFALGKASDNLFSSRFYDWFSRMRLKDYPSVTLPNGRNIVVPSMELNLIYQLVHIDQHFGPGGVGLRQILDYYYLLREAGRRGYDFEEYRNVVSKLKLKKIGGSLMYVLRHVMHMDDSMLPLEIDERHGRFMLREIAEGGNFGYLRRARNAGYSTFGRRLRNLGRNLRFIPYFPGSAFRHYYKAIKGLFK